MKDAISSAAEALVYKDEYNHDKFWESVSKFDGKALALVISECPEEFSSYEVEEHNIDLGKLDASDWILLLSRYPTIAKSISFNCEESVWECEARISKDELAPGIRWWYRIHTGRAYIEGTRGRVSECDDVLGVVNEKVRADGEEWYWQTDATMNLNALCGGTVVIPSHIDGLPVFSLGRDTFEGCGFGLGKLIVSEGIVEIGRFAFDGGASPNEVLLPSTLRYIRDYAFSGCRLLKELAIPEGCESIGDLAFEGCCGLKRIIIPRTVKSIGDEAFLNCENLEEVVIESYDCQFGKGILNGCRSIRKITGPLSSQLEAANFQ